MKKMTTFPNQMFPCSEPDPLSFTVKQEFPEDVQPTFSLLPKIDLKIEPDNTFLRAVDPLSLNNECVAFDISSHSVKIEREEEYHETNTTISPFRQLPTAILTNESVPQTQNNDVVSLLMKNLLDPSLEKYQTAEDSNTLDIVEHKLEKFDPPSIESSSIELKPTTQGTVIEEKVYSIISRKARDDETKMLATPITPVNASYGGNQIAKEQIVSTLLSKAVRVTDYGANQETIIGLCEAPEIPDTSQLPYRKATNRAVKTKQNCRSAVTERNFSPAKNNRTELTMNHHQKLHLRKEKNYLCADCSPEVSFVYKKSLSQHIKAVHLKLYYFKCEVCRKVLNRRKFNEHMSTHVLHPRTDKCLELKKSEPVRVIQYYRVLRPRILSKTSQNPLTVDQNLTADGFVFTKDKQATEKKNNSFTLNGCAKLVSGHQAESEQIENYVNQSPHNKNQENVPSLESTGEILKTFLMRPLPLRVENAFSVKKLPRSVGEEQTNVTASSKEEPHITGNPTHMVPSCLMQSNNTSGKVGSKIEIFTKPQQSYLDAFNRFWQTERNYSKEKRTFVKTVEKNIQCPECPKLCYSEFHLGTHILARHTPHICGDCSPQRSFPNKTRLRRHIEMVHLKSHRYKCKICGDMLNKKQEKKHMSVHKRKKILCSHCRLNFPGVQKLLEHLKIHTGNASYPCRYCIKYYEKRQEYVKHLRSEHRSERKVICEYCGERFFNLTNLYTHKAKHTGRYLCACATCGREFVHKHQLAAHVGTIACQQAALAAKGVAVEKRDNKKRKSTTRKMFECANCNEHFSLKRPLIVHIKSKICEAQASGSSKNKNTPVRGGSTAALPKRKKMGEKENGEKVAASKNPVVCANCKESFKLKHHLIIHLETKICEARISNSSENTSSSTQGNDTAHLSNTTKVRKKENRTPISKSKNPVICANCKESFKLKRHLIVHLKTKICEAHVSSSSENTKSAIQASNTATPAKTMNTQKKENENEITNSNNPVVCNICKEPFKLKRHLINHLKTKICEAQISNFPENKESPGHAAKTTPLFEGKSIDREEARKEIAKSENPIVCPNCKESFKLNGDLIIHLKTKICEAQTSNSFGRSKSAMDGDKTTPASRSTNIQRKGKIERKFTSRNRLTPANCDGSVSVDHHVTLRSRNNSRKIQSTSSCENKKSSAHQQKKRTKRT